VGLASALTEGVLLAPHTGSAISAAATSEIEGDAGEVKTNSPVNKEQTLTVAIFLLCVRNFIRGSGGQESGVDQGQGQLVNFYLIILFYV
jgi:hypothetical protein